MGDGPANSCWLIEEESSGLWENCLVSLPNSWDYARYFFGKLMLMFFFLLDNRPEDIFGSVQVDGEGNIEGNFQASGTYRIVTNDGM